jgi:hypothetical protein
LLTLGVGLESAQASSNTSNSIDYHEYSNRYPLWFPVCSSQFRSTDIGTDLEKECAQDRNSNALVPYSENPIESFFRKKGKLATALASSSLNGAKYILEGQRKLGSAAMVSDAATLIKIAKNIYQMTHSNSTCYPNASFYVDLVSDMGVIGSNYFLSSRGFQDQAGLERFYYSLLKAPSTLNSEIKKLKNQERPETWISAEGFEFLRHLSLFGAELANLAFKHYRYTTAMSAVLAYRAANHAYEFATEYNTQEEFQVTPTLIRNIMIGTILAAQVPLQYSMHYGHLGVLIAIEYISYALLTYDNA